MADYDGPPPSKASLMKWWKSFTSKDKNKSNTSSSSSANPPPLPPPMNTRQGSLSTYAPPGRGLERGKDGKGRVFGVSLEQSLQYASVAISMVGADGKQYVYGYVPIVVAKCGMMLKETATQTEGIFRVSGSNKRINQLQVVFDEPPRYGKDFDWTGYSVHDAASVLRRYLNSLPEPVIPAGLYLDFTAVLQRPQPISDSIAAYRHLISLLPPASRYLLLYLLDFLSVFARCSSKNLMTASNLAVVFQPGLVSSRRDGTNSALLGFPGFVEGRPPPNGSSTATASPGLGTGSKAQEQAGEHGKGKEVLEFLIEQQGHFMIGLEPPVDAERQKNKGVDSPVVPNHSTLSPPPPPTATSSTSTPLETKEQAQERSLLMMKGSTDLTRRGSDKSIERRRLRKSTDHAGKEGTTGKVKRSKTWGSSSGKRKARNERAESTPAPTPNPQQLSTGFPPTTSSPSTSSPRTQQQQQLPPRPPPSNAPLPPSLAPPTASGSSTRRSSMDLPRPTRNTNSNVAATTSNPSTSTTTTTPSNSTKKPRKSATNTAEPSLPPVPTVSTTTTTTTTSSIPIPSTASTGMIKTSSTSSSSNNAGGVAGTVAQQEGVPKWANPKSRR